VGLFRREPHHVRLAREGGLDQGEPDEARPPWDKPGIHGLQRAREWDVVTTVRSPEQAAERVEFVAIAPNETASDGDAAPFTAALAGRPPQPYRGEAVYRGDGQWAVAARRIQIVRLPGVEGQEIELSSYADERTLTVDGARQMGTIPALERPEHVVRARRVLGDAWEVETAPL
jgi:hypothetical protein